MNGLSRFTSIFEVMQLTNVSGILTENHEFTSPSLEREVKIDFYYPQIASTGSVGNLLLINDGQNLEEMGFAHVLENLISSNRISPLVCVGIHAGELRKMEYGIAAETDYLGRGAKAPDYSTFILNELLPFIFSRYPQLHEGKKAFAGFSLGGLTALDIVWNHPDQFSIAGVFSGSLWWRSMDQNSADYDDQKHRIMHQLIRKGKFHPGLKFFLQCGNKDETMDRNNNGIIDSVDDTLDLVKELKAKGYTDNDIFYLELQDGSHDIPTWGRAMPLFLEWAFKKTI